MSKQVVNLDDNINLFTSEAAFEEFIRELTAALKSDFRPIIANGEMLGVDISPGTAKLMLMERISQSHSLDEIMTLAFPDSQP